MSELEPLSIDQFSKFFTTIQGYSPFDWQRMLAERVKKEGWPDVIDLPTASGKTACMDVAIFNLALEADRPVQERTAARRIWFVVDRRIVVDEAYNRAWRISIALEYFVANDKRRNEIRNDKATKEFIKGIESRDHSILPIVARRLLHVAGTRHLPLAIARLRGGVPRQSGWSYNPAQPAVITTTVDQIGSRLLFRAYGSGALAGPIHAGLAANDSLIILDEGHLSTPFEQTVRRIKEYRKIGTDADRPRTPFYFVLMSATPPQSSTDTLSIFPKPEEREEALRHELLKQRASASKPANLIEVNAASEETDPLVDSAVIEAKEILKSRFRIAVMVNRVKTAYAIFAGLREILDADVVLLTGRLRPVERDELIAKWNGHLKSDSKLEMARPLILVTTQCLEVGADYSFDALITECASLDALRQRFGRLNRLGRSEWNPTRAVILIRKNQHQPEAKLKDEDPIYGYALSRTWTWLAANATASPIDGSKPVKKQSRAPASAISVDMGITALSTKLPRDPTELAGLLAPRENAPILLPAYIDLLSQTGPRPAIEPDISLFLHGAQRTMPEASVVWRADLGDKCSDWEEIISLMPPLGGEKLSVPVFRLREWLENGLTLAPDDTGDAESQATVASDHKQRKPSLPFLLWRGKSRIEVSVDAGSIRTGDTVVVPANYGFPTSIGQRVEEGSIDIYDLARPVARAEQVLRVHRSLTPRSVDEGDLSQWQELLAMATQPDDDFDRIEFLATITPFIPVDAKSPLKVLRSYPGQGGMIVVWNSKVESSELDLDPFEFDDLELVTEQNGATLQAHTTEVAKHASNFSGLCLGRAFVDLFNSAANDHDLGKADERFQQCLKNGRRFGSPELLAKSRVDISMARWQQLRDLTGLPADFRHEMLSLQIITSGLNGTDAENALLLHLIASHHGHARPFAPISLESAPPPVELELNGGQHAITAEGRRQLPPHRLASGVAERFWTLTRQHGWWGLAYLEAVLRLADQQASRAAEE